MSRLIRMFDVFVSSPGDVTAERERLQEVVSRINRPSLRNHGVLLNLILWETDVQSSKGTDLQSVVNSQVGNTYDVYLGIIWSRIGTETPRAPSGTVEEFERALDRHKNGDQNLRFMFFIRTGNYPDAIDPGQLTAVQAFRKRLGKEGLLSKPYKTIEEFQDTAYEHLLDYLDQQVAKGQHDERPAATSALAVVRNLLPDLGVHLVRGVQEFQSLVEARRNAEARSLVAALASDLETLEGAVAKLEQQACLVEAEIARSIVIGDNSERESAANRLDGLMDEARAAKKSISEFQGPLLQLVKSTDLDPTLLVHLKKAVAVTDRFLTLLTQSITHLSKLAALARIPPNLSPNEHLAE